jgi:hypothetical protein
MMKFCPECRREYDNTMMFCLDDGAELFYGPASGDEPGHILMRCNDKFAATIREAFAKGGWPAVIHAELTRFERQSIPDRSSHCQKARYLSALGKKDEAFAELERSLADREFPSLVFARSDPRVDALRDDPRFDDVLRRIGFR